MSPGPSPLPSPAPAFPSQRSIVGTNGTTATTTASVTLPSNLVAGELLLLLHRCMAGAINSTPTGWAELLRNTADASGDGMLVCWKQATGSEGGTVTVSQTSGKFASLAFAITGGATSGNYTPSISTSNAVGTTATPTPATGTAPPGVSAVPVLIIWLGGWQGTQTSPPTGNPTGYTLANSRQGADSGSAAGAATNGRVATAARQASVLTETGQSWTLSATPSGWSAMVCFISPMPVVTEIGATAAVGRASVWAKKLGRRWVRDRHGLLVPEYA